MNRYISKIHLENFQGYRDETIVLKQGLNLLVGSSDSGKSAVLRGISFVLYNHPKNKSLIHDGASEVRVTIEFSDGVSITRIRGDRNAVMCATADGDLKIWDKIEHDLPSEIKELLGNPPMDDFNGFISYADQFSNMFLVDLSPTDLPRSLSNLTGVEILEQSAKELMQNYKAEEKQIKSYEKEYKKLKDEQLLYQCLENHTESLENCQLMINNIQQLDDNILALESFKDIIDPALNKENLLICDSIIDKIYKLLKLQTKLQKISDEIDKLSIFDLVIDEEIYADTDISIDQFIIKINSVLEKIVELKSLNDIIDNFLIIEKNYSDIKTCGTQYTQEYKQMQSNIIFLEKDLIIFKQFLKDNNIQCEVCGSKL